MSWWDRIKIEEVRIFGLFNFKNEFTYYLNKKKEIVVGQNNSGKTSILKSIEFFFNENKYFKSLSNNDVMLTEGAYIEMTFNVFGISVGVRKDIVTTKSAVKVKETGYSREDFDHKLLDYQELAFVYFFSSERLLSEKDNEFDFIKNSIHSRVLEKSLDSISNINKEISSWIDEYEGTLFKGLDDELEIEHNLSFNTGLKITLDWINSPFKNYGSAQKKCLALKVLESYIKYRSKGPSILLIDMIENHLDKENLTKQLNTLNELNTSLQLISTFSWSTYNTLKNTYRTSIVDLNKPSNLHVENMYLSDLSDILI